MRRLTLAFSTACGGEQGRGRTALERARGLRCATGPHPRLPPHAGAGARVCARIVCGVALAAWVFLGAGAALARDDNRFINKDWELACDNTRTCRAAGYQVDTGNERPVSLRITRAAGPNAPIAMTMKIEADTDEQADSILQKGLLLQIGTVSLRVLKAVSETETPYFFRHILRLTLTSEQVRAALPEMLNASEAPIWIGSNANGDPDGRLSLNGLNAVLLKMDDWQGRVGTPGALVRRGGKPESSVLPPLPLPVVRVAAPVATRPADANLIGRIFPLLDLAVINDVCGDKAFSRGRRKVNRLTNQHILLSFQCPAGFGDGVIWYWIADDKPPYTLQAVDTQEDGNYEHTGGFDSVTMSIESIGRNGGNETDCMNIKFWHFNGQKFVLTRSSSDSLCRGFDDGAWDLPTYVAKVIPAASQPKKP